MKKVMFLIVGLLFASSVNAATLQLAGHPANDGSVSISSGQVVRASWDSSKAGGETVSDHYRVRSNSLTGGYLSLTFNTLSKGTTVGIDDGTGIVNLAISAVSGLGFVDYFWVLSAGAIYDIYIDIVSANAGSNYDLRIETPIPAALFLFANHNYCPHSLIRCLCRYHK